MEVPGYVHRDLFDTSQRRLPSSPVLLHVILPELAPHLTLSMICPVVSSSQAYRVLSHLTTLLNRIIPPLYCPSCEHCAQIVNSRSLTLLNGCARSQDLNDHEKRTEVTHSPLVHSWRKSSCYRSRIEQICSPSWVHRPNKTTLLHLSLQSRMHGDRVPRQ